MNIPSTWAEKKLSDVCNTTSGGTPSRKRKNYFTGTIPWVKSGELTDGLVRDIEECITDQAIKNSSAKIFPSGTLLIALYGATVGKLGILTRDAASNQAVCAIFPQNELDTKYLFWYLRYVRSDIVSQAIGGAQPNISQGILKNLDIPIAPLSEQHLIVSGIEKQFSRLDEAVAALKRIKANLKRYKASVLKAAVEGTLTEEWRRGGSRTAPIESGRDLLKCILAERRKKWEKEHPGKKYKEPAEPDISILPELPKGWVWARLDSIADIKGGITVDKKRIIPNSRNIAYLRVANVQRGYLDLSEIKEIQASGADIKALRLRRGDILFNEGGDRDKLGRGWIWEDQIPECIHQNHVFRARLFLPTMSSKLISWWGNTFGKNYFLREGKQTTNLASVNLTKLSVFPVPLPSLIEQQLITEEIERRLSVAEEIEVEIDTNLKRAERLRQSILKKAFSGRLV